MGQSAKKVGKPPRPVFLMPRHDCTHRRSVRYLLYAQELTSFCPFRDFGIPTRRRRSYWVGRLKAHA